jgi:hypothetical protein
VPPLCERAQVDAVLVPAVREADPALGAVLEGGADDGAALDHAVVLRSMKGEQRVADKRSVREARAGSARAPRAARALRAFESAHHAEDAHRRTAVAVLEQVGRKQRGRAGPEGVHVLGGPTAAAAHDLSEEGLGRREQLGRRVGVDFVGPLRRWRVASAESCDGGEREELLEGSRGELPVADREEVALQLVCALAREVVARLRARELLVDDLGRLRA